MKEDFISDAVSTDVDKTRLESLEDVNFVSAMAAKTLTSLFIQTGTLVVVANLSDVDPTDDAQIAAAIWTNLIATVEDLLVQTGDLAAS